MRASSSVGFVLVFAGALTTAAHAQSASARLFAGSPQYPVLPRALEIELALSAAPAHLRGGDIGGARGAFVFMNRVGPDGMMIVPVGERERQAIVSESQPLVAQVEHALGYQATPADTPAAAPTTAVLVNLTIKPDVERS